ncbi:ComEA family DNA-binding protein [Pseudochryseolinea flava]|uniref:Helix-hairpin-helix domain-containing protein n=1 Tax=Pseudochryseolinea flava TaxID=2059302 RepID=A0A364Y3H1_9BACT|nr:helix-hairpin-helix domain-containing protein [Pseudochryseolinea flava]RAW00696.1 hypothetical protein DQQ10_14010 [Pseudochryseolinea flava]
MFKLRRLVRDFFGFPRAHINAFLIMLPLMVVALCSQPIYHFFQLQHTVDLSSDIGKLDSIAALWKKLPVDHPRAAQRSKMFHFDPNRATTIEFDSLGFSDALASRITNYRKKGGRFRVKHDLLKIFGMDSAFYRRLYPYIDLPISVQRAYDTTTFKKPMVQRFQKSALSSFDLNVADTTQLKLIRGIGTKLSIRILKYRDALGGFVNENQLGEVFGLDTTVVKLLKDNGFIAVDFRPRKLYVNRLNEKELSTHPYISGFVARAIVAYRFQHGDFHNVEDLRKIPTLKSETIQKITPYLEFEK